MKASLILGLIMGLTTMTQAQDYDVYVSHSLAQARLTRQEVIDYQVNASSKQYRPEDVLRIAKLVKERVEGHLDALDQAERTIVTVYNSNKELSGVSWLSNTNPEYVTISQSSCTDKSVFGIFLEVAAKQYPEATKVRTILAKERPYLSELFSMTGWTSIPIYYDIDEKHNDTDYSAFEIAKVHIPNCIKSMPVLMEKLSQK